MTCSTESNQFEIRYILEVTPGTAPATGDMQIMRTTGVGGGVAKSTVVSEEIRDDRQIVDLVMTKKEPTKDINAEFSFETFDDFLEAALFTDWSNVDYRSNDVEVLAGDVYELPTGHGLTFLPGEIIRVAGFTTAANNGDKSVLSFSGDTLTVNETLTIEAAGDTVTIKTLGYTDNDIEVTSTSTYELLSGHGLTFIPGQTIFVAGFTDPANNGAKTVSAFSGDLITVEETLVVEAPGDTVIFKYDVLANGVTKKTYTIEDDFTDVAKVRTMTGMVVNTFGIDVPKESKISVVINLLGQNTTPGNTSEVAGTPIEPNDNEIINTGEHVADIYEGGVLKNLVESLTLEIGNNLRGLGAIGAIENICVASGQINVTGTLVVYFEDWTTYSKFLANTASSLRFKLGDSNGDYYFNIPRIKFSGDEVNAGGPNQDVMENGEFQAMRDPTTGLTMIITKVTT